MPDAAVAVAGVAGCLGGVVGGAVGLAAGAGGGAVAASTVVATTLAGTSPVILTSSALNALNYIDNILRMPHENWRTELKELRSLVESQKRSIEDIQMMNGLPEKLQNEYLKCIIDVDLVMKDICKNVLQPLESQTWLSTGRRKFGQFVFGATSRKIRKARKQLQVLHARLQFAMVPQILAASAQLDGLERMITDSSEEIKREIAQAVATLRAGLDTLIDNVVVQNNMLKNFQENADDHHADIMDGLHEILDKLHWTRTVLIACVVAAYLCVFALGFASGLHVEELAAVLGDRVYLVARLFLWVKPAPVPVPEPQPDPSFAHTLLRLYVGFCREQWPLVHPAICLVSLFVALSLGASYALIRGQRFREAHAVRLSLKRYPPMADAKVIVDSDLRGPYKKS